ncbi:hypothetical protein EJV46_02675 [Roseococcus sp. SYP-B2431]|uniref:hypothetical protein n=1 Tax=Roseococcus sp. SYP-B2431 TaxID=2496640 RepID=UPI00103C3B49|nr:hypothetical protein [Roseococcus sp. SYP-B2431]TCH99596.1 hypothetical protein EJV46_02675 [Roseococcus sp. SYP-B2431]
MAEDTPGNDPVISQISTAELKRILTDRFAASVVKESWNRIWRPLAFLGVTGIALAGTLAFNLIDARVATQTSDIREKLQTSLSGQLSRDIPSGARLAVADAFVTQWGQRAMASLEHALEPGGELRARLDSLVREGLLEAWRTNSEHLRTAFLQQLRDQSDFRASFAGDVVQELARSGAVPRMTSDALRRSVETRSAEDSGILIALALLASMDQARANAGVAALVERAATREERSVALKALATVSFAGTTSEGDDTAALLRNALRSWRLYCAEVVCASDATARTSLANFFRRGRELPIDQRQAWVAALSRWHQDFVQQLDAPGRESSLDIVPQALARIGSAEAIEVLATWAQSDNLDLALSAASGIGSLSAEAYPDNLRIALFRAVWNKLVDPTTINAAVEEAAWMAIGMISRGTASATRGPYLTEASLSRSFLRSASGSGSSLAAWTTGRSFDFQDFSEIRRPPRDPCSIEADQRSQSVSRMRPGLCSLVALMRPARGTAEWFELRPYLTHRDRVALLGLLWAMSANAASHGAIAPSAKEAPLSDLLTLAQPTPPLLQLAAILIARTMSDREAWGAFDAFRNVMSDATPFLAANRWIHRPSDEDRTWFLDRVRQLPRPERRSVLMAMFGSLDPRVGSGSPRSSTPFSRSLRENPTGILNVLALALAADAPVAVELLERYDGFRELYRLMESSRLPFGFDDSSARRIGADIMQAAGWTPLERSGLSPASLNAEVAPLAPQADERFGLLRLPSGPEVFLRLSSPAGPVAFFEIDRREARLLQHNEIWILPRAAGTNPQPRTWAYRLSSHEAAELRVEMPVPLDIASGGTSVIEPDRLFRVHLNSGSDGTARVDGISRGDIIEVATYGLDRDVDTVVTLFRDETGLVNDDDGGDGLASRLSWEADRDGPLRLRLRNIGRSGGFSVLLTVRKP